MYRLSREKEMFWIGLNDRAREGKFVWSDGSRYNYSLWSKGEPNNYRKKEDCVVINYTKNNEGRWNDWNCAAKEKFICSRTGGS